jgi:hypothetical protein
MITQIGFTFQPAHLLCHLGISDQISKRISVYKGDRLILNIKTVVRPLSPQRRSQTG